MQPAHRITQGDYTKLYGLTVVHEEKHYCQVENCKGQTLWDKSNISQHLRVHDLMSLQDYEEKYMGNYSPKASESVASSD